MATADVVIRRVEPDDADALRDTMTGERAYTGTMQLPYPSRREWRQRLAEPPEGIFVLVACADDEAGEVVGSLALETNPSRPRRRHVATLGMSVRDDWQGRGVGTALMRAAVELADDWLQVTRLELSVYTDNEPALALYRRFGFEVEGTKRRDVFRAGEYVDLHLMARLHPRLEDWGPDR